MKLVITEEDYRRIDTLVDRFDPARSLQRPLSISEEDWDTYVAPLRGDLRIEIWQAMIAQTLKDAGLIYDDRQLPDGLFNLAPVARREGESRQTEAWDRAYERVTANWGPAASDDEDNFLRPYQEAIEAARAAVMVEV